MKKTRFFILFRTLTEKEIRDFEFFVLNLYKRQKKAVTVFKVIKHYWDKSPNDELEKEKILRHRHIKALSLNSKGFSNLLSDLYQMLEEFLILEKLKSNSVVERDLLMLQVLKERKADKLFFQKTKALGNKLGGKGKISARDYLSKFELDFFHFFHIGTQKMQSKIPSLDTGLANLDAFYIITRLKYICELLNRSKILQQKYTPKETKEFIQYCRRYRKQAGVISQIYLLAYEVLCYEKESTFIRLQNLFRKHITALTREDQSIILGYLINFAIEKSQEQPNVYYRKIFALYNIALQQDLIVENGIISSSSFLNISNVAAQRRAFNWLKDFMNEYSPYLLEHLRSEVLAISQAYEAYERGHYPKVVSYLSKLKYATQIDFALRIKPLLVRALWEMYGDDDPVRDAIKAFELYLLRNRVISRKTIKGYLNFIKFIKKLLRKRKPNTEQLLLDLESQKNIYYKLWLKEQVIKLK